MSYTCSSTFNCNWNRVQVWNHYWNHNTFTLRMEVDDDEGTRDMMGAIEEVVRLREEKEARLASLRAEAEELRGAIQ